MSKLELADIIDSQEIQSLMDDFYKFAHITMALVDLKGNVLVSVGWQDICTRFHRIHPETCKHCIESDTKLSAGIFPGEFKLYKCKNNMWDIATPIIVGGQHVGNIFSGQFFFDNEPLDYELFRTQAREYGFDEEEYIAALEKVPRLSREAVDTGMAFLTKLANMISQLSYSNIKLSQSLAERNSLVDALQKNREDLDRAQAVGTLGSWRLNVRKNELTWSDEAHRIFGIPKGTPLTYETFLSTVHTDDRKYVDKKWKAGLAGEPYDIEHRIIVDGKVKWVREKAYIEFDNDGTIFGGFGITQDITDRKDTEETLAFERSQLLSIFDGMDDVVYVTDPYTYEVLYANKAMKEKFGGELVGGICYREFQRRDSPCYFCTNPIILKERDKPYHWEYYNPSVDRHFIIMDRIIKWPDGRDVRLEIAKDITERKRIEEALRESEAKYRDVFETVQEVFYIDQLIYDEQGNVVDWIFEDLNPAGFELLGLKDIDEARGKRGSEVLGCKVASFYLPMIEKARRSSKAVTFQYRSPYVDKEFLTSYIVRDNRLISAQMDVTELKEIEAALRESEERLRLLGDNLPDSAVYQYTHEHDGSVRFLYFSAGIEQLNGVSISDVLRDPGTLHRQIPPEYFERLLEAEAKSARELSDFDMEIPMRLPDGQIRWMRLHSRPRRLPDGRTAWDGVQTDITELKRAEEVLRETELSRKVAEAVESERQRLFDVLETLPVMICLLTLDHYIAFANRSFREKFGEPDGRHCYEHFFGRTQPCEFCESYKVLETGQSQNCKVTIPDGSIIDVYSFPFTDVDGSPMILKMDIDITERKQAEEKLRDSEEKYRNIVETANEIILITDKESIVTYVNKKMVDMLGYALEEFIGRPIWSFISEECKPIVKMNLKKRMQGISESYELKLIRKDGSSLWAFLNAKPLFDKEGKYIGAMSMLTDITKRKEAEEALTIIETARKKEIHHRIKNNLQVISSLLDLQAEQFRDRENIKDSEVLEAFRESQDRVISMALIHEELYKGGGLETLNFSPYIKELVENLFHSYRLGDTDVSLNMDLEENVFFDMDTAVPLGMIVNELVSNSLKHAFTGRDRGEIRIKLHREESTELESENSKSTSASFILTISDNGVGIPEDLDVEDLDSLGMQLVISLVDQLEGELEMKRENGTEFTMKFTVIEIDNLAQAGLRS